MIAVNKVKESFLLMNGVETKKRDCLKFLWMRQSLEYEEISMKYKVNSKCQSYLQVISIKAKTCGLTIYCL